MQDPDNQPNAACGRVRLALAVLMLGGFAARVAAIVLLKAWENPSAMEHRGIALFMLEGHGFTFHDWGVTQHTSVQSPPYPLLLAGLFYLFGPESDGAYIAAMLLNAALGAACVWLAYKAARVVGGSARVALIAAALVAFWPTQVYAATAAQAVVGITAAMVAVCWLFYHALDTGRLLPWVAFSAIGCVAALTEPVLLPPMALTGLIIFVWPGTLTFKLRLRNAAVLLLAAIVILGPWTLRNYHVHDKFMPVKSTFWVNVWKGNNPHATGTDRVAMADVWRERFEDESLQDVSQTARSAEVDHLRQYSTLTDAQRAQLTGKTEVEREAVFKEFTTGWIGEHPGGYLRLCGVRIVKTLWIDWDNPKSHNAVYVGSRATLLVLTAVGLVLALRSRWRLGYVAVLFFAGMLLYTLTITAARFILPFEPFALCLSALALERVAALAAPKLRRGGEVAA